MKYGARDTVWDFEGQAIDQVRSFAPFGSSRARIDASIYGEDWTSTVAGLRDGDEVAIVCAFDPTSATQQAIIMAYEDDPDTPVTFTSTHVDSGSGFDINCIVVAIEHDRPVDGLLALLITIKIVNPGVVSTARSFDNEFVESEFA